MLDGTCIIFYFRRTRRYICAPPCAASGRRTRKFPCPASTSLHGVNDTFACGTMYGAMVPVFLDSLKTRQPHSGLRHVFRTLSFVPCALCPPGSPSSLARVPGRTAVLSACGSDHGFGVCWNRPPCGNAICIHGCSVWKAESFDGFACCTSTHSIWMAMRRPARF